MQDQRILQPKVGATARVGAEPTSVGLHDVFARSDIGGTGCVKRLADGDEGFLGLEERIAVLQEKGEGKARFEVGGTEEHLKVLWTRRGGEVVSERGVEG